MLLSFQRMESGSSTFKCKCVLSEITDVLDRGSSSIKLANLDVRGKTLGLPEKKAV